MSLAQTLEGANKCQVPKEWCGSAMIVSLWYLFQIFMLASSSASPCVWLSCNMCVRLLCLCLYVSWMSLLSASVCGCLYVRMCAYLLWLSWYSSSASLGLEPRPLTTKPTNRARVVSASWVPIHCPQIPSHPSAPPG